MCIVFLKEEKRSVKPRRSADSHSYFSVSLCSQLALSASSEY